MTAMNNRMQEQKMMLRKITEAGFALDDALLYMDTHPCDTKALAAYRMMEETYNALVEQYAKQFGPLTKTQVMSNNYFSWVSDPWPWEGVDC